MQIGDIEVDRTIVAHGMGVPVGIIEVLQNVSGIAHGVIAVLHEEHAIDVEVQVVHRTYVLHDAGTGGIVDVAVSVGTIGCACQLAAIHPAHSPAFAVIVAGGITGGVVSDGLAVEGGQQVLPVRVAVGIAVGGGSVGCALDVAYGIVGVERLAMEPEGSMAYILFRNNPLHLDCLAFFRYCD